MYSDMTRWDLIEELLAANDEIVRLKAKRSQARGRFRVRRDRARRVEERYDRLQIENRDLAAENTKRRRLSEWNA